MLTVLDLFSGIGGFSLGLERTGGFKTIGFCEIDPYCRAVLKKHWPEVPCHPDIRYLPKIKCDVITGGFPCQPFSTASAGKRYGSNHDSYLWPEMGNAIQTCRPSWVIGENVIGIESMALDSLVSDLEGWGYEVAPPLEIPACAVGHDHRRARIWILAHSHKDSQPGRAINAEAPVMQGCGINAKNVGIPDGVPAGLDRRRLQVLGNAIAPQIAEMIGRAILAAEATLALGERQQEGK